MGEVGCLKDGNFQNLEAEEVAVTNLTISGRLNTNLTTHVLSVDGVDGVTAIEVDTAATDTGQTFLPNTLNIFDVTRTVASGLETTGDVYGFQLPTLASTSPGDVIRVIVTALTGTNGAEAIYNINVKGSEEILGSLLAVYSDPVAFVATSGTLADFRGKNQSVLVHAAASVAGGAGKVVFRPKQHGGGQIGTDITFVNRNGAYWEIGGRFVMTVGSHAHQPIGAGPIFNT